MNSGYVNLHGSPVFVPSLIDIIGQKRKTSRADQDPEYRARLIGYAVTGFSPEFVQRLRNWHTAKQAALAKQGKETAPFNLDLALGSERPKRARQKPYELKEAAIECAALMRKAGWVPVAVREVKK